MGQIFQDEDSRLFASELLPGFHEFGFGVIAFELDDDYLPGVISVCDRCSWPDSMCPVDIVQCERHVHVVEQCCNYRVQLLTTCIFLYSGDTDIRSSDILLQVIQCLFELVDSFVFFYQRLLRLQ